MKNWFERKWYWWFGENWRAAAWNFDDPRTRVKEGTRTKMPVITDASMDGASEGIDEYGIPYSMAPVSIALEESGSDDLVKRPFEGWWKYILTTLIGIGSAIVILAISAWTRKNH